MVSAPKDYSKHIPMHSGTYVSINQPKARKSLCQLATKLDFTPKTYIRRLCAAKSKCK